MKIRTRIIISIVASSPVVSLLAADKKKLQFFSVLEGEVWSGEVDGSLQTGDLLVIIGVYVSVDVVGSRRNGSWQIDALGDGHRPRLKRAGKVNIAKLLTQVRGRRDQLNEAVFDDHFDVRALCDGLLNLGRGCDEKALAGLRGIGSHINFLEHDKIIVTVGIAELERALSRNLEATKCGDRVTPDGNGRRRSSEAGGQAGDGSRETHRQVLSILAE